MNERTTTSPVERQAASQVISTVVTRDPRTGEFKYQQMLVDDPDIAPELQQPADEPYVPISNENQVTDLPERGSKRRLRRQRIGHGVLFAVAVSGLYTAGDYVVTGAKSGRVPNVIEDAVQIPSDLNKTYDAMRSAVDAMQSWGKNAEQIKQYLPENGDK